jgi:hypothetical protein
MLGNVGDEAARQVLRERVVLVAGRGGDGAGGGGGQLKRKLGVR